MDLQKSTSYVSTKITDFFIFALSLRNTYLYQHIKMFINNAQFNGHISAVYRNGIDTHTELNIYNLV